MDKEIQTELVIKAQNKNQEAFVVLLEQLKEKLLRISYSILSNEDKAKDAVSETTYLAYKNIKKLKQPEFFETWVIRILINECNKELRKSKLLLPFEYFKEKVVHHSKEDINDYLVNLNKEEKAIVSLKFIAGYTLKEISQILEQPESTIKSKYYKALSFLKIEMEVGVNE